MVRAAISAQFWQDEAWGYDHFGELARQYGTAWVAIANRAVVAASTDLSEVERLAQQRTGRRDCPVLFVERGGHVYTHSTPR